MKRSFSSSINFCRKNEVSNFEIFVDSVFVPFRDPCGAKLLAASKRYANLYILSIYLPTYIPTYLYTYLPIFLPTNLPTYLYTYQPIYLPTNLPTYIPTYLFTYLPIYLPIYIFMSIYLHAHIPTCLNTYVPKYLRAYIPKCLYTSLIFCCHVTQRVILPPHMPWIGQGGCLLFYSMICVLGLVIFDYKWEGSTYLL